MTSVGGAEGHREGGGSHGSTQRNSFTVCDRRIIPSHPRMLMCRGEALRGWHKALPDAIGPSCTSVEHRRGPHAPWTAWESGHAYVEYAM